MAAEDLISVAPPGERRAVPFRGNTRSAVIAVIGAVAVTAFMWAMLWKFDQSLVVNQARQTTARVFEIVIALATLVVPIFAFRALLASVRGMQQARAGDRRSAQIAVADSRDDIQVVIGLGLSA